MFITFVLFGCSSDCVFLFQYYSALLLFNSYDHNTAQVAFDRNEIITSDNITIETIIVHHIEIYFLNKTV